MELFDSSSLQPLQGQPLLMRSTAVRLALESNPPFGSILEGEARQTAIAIVEQCGSFLFDLPGDVAGLLQGRVAELCRAFCSLASAIDHGYALYALRCILKVENETLRANPSLANIFCSVHVDILALCVVTRSYKLAAQSIVPRMLDHQEYVGRPLLATDIQLIHYYMCLIYIAEQKYAEALYQARLTIIVPATILTDVSLAAVKKYILLSMMCQTTERFVQIEAMASSQALAQGTAQTAAKDKNVFLPGVFAAPLPSEMPASLQRIAQQLISSYTSLLGILSPNKPVRSSYAGQDPTPAAGSRDIKRGSPLESSPPASSPHAIQVPRYPSDSLADPVSARGPDTNTLDGMNMDPIAQTNDSSVFEPAPANLAGTDRGTLESSNASLDADDDGEGDGEEGGDNLVASGSVSEGGPSAEVPSGAGGAGGPVGGAGRRGKVKTMKAMMHRLREYIPEFEHDGNLGLVKQVVKALHRLHIVLLTRRYLTLSLSDVADKSGLEYRKASVSAMENGDGGGGESGMFDVEQVLMDMVSCGEISSRIDAVHNEKVSFGEPPSKELKSSSLASIGNQASLDDSIMRTTSLLDEISRLKSTLELDPKFIQRQIVLETKTRKPFSGRLGGSGDIDA